MREQHKTFMKIAFLFAEMSHCVSHRVGAIIVKNGRIVVSGINGTFPGAKNCDEIFDKNHFNREEHHKWSINNEIHAEMNCIIYAAKNGINISDGDMYVTLSPCNDCLKNISMAGIKNVYYLYKYDKSDLITFPNINVQKVPNAEEIKKFVEKNNLLF